MASQQILLQQPPSESGISPSWFLFSGSYNESEGAETIFKSVIFDLLQLKIDNVHPVYSYFDEQKKINQVIVYSILDKARDFPPKNGTSFVWFSFKDVIKMHLTQQTKHDIVVGQRVIEAAARINRGEYSLQ